MTKVNIERYLCVGDGDVQAAKRLFPRLHTIFYLIITF